MGVWCSMESQDDQRFVVGVDPRALRHVEDLDAQNNAAEGTEFQSMTAMHY